MILDGGDGARDGATLRPRERCSAQFQSAAHSIPVVQLGVAIIALLFSEELARDHQPLNFAGAFADGAELDVAIIFFRRIIFDEAIAAENLHGFVRDAHSDFAGEEFRHARFARETSDLPVGHPRGAVHEQARGIDFAWPCRRA